MRSKRKLLIEQLDQKLKPYLASRNTQVPDKGWINTIRTTLNMTMAQLGKRLNITRQGVKSIEDSESKGTISLKALSEVAEAMDLKVVYALIPKNGTIDELITMKAEEFAKRVVLRTNQNMKLEDQAIAEDKISKSIRDLAFEMKREMKRSLWD